MQHAADELPQRLVRRIDAEWIAFEVASDPEARFRRDAAELQEIIGNLLDNAAKSARSRVRMRSHVTDGRSDESIRVLRHSPGRECRGASPLT